MTNATLSPPAPAPRRSHTPSASDLARRRRHRYWILLGSGLAAAVSATLCVYGMGYYFLSPAARLASPKHALLKPSGTIGNALGTVGAALLVLIYLYPLRKKWPWLARKGKNKNWLDYHILMGLVAPVLITFHSSFKLSGVPGMAWWSMVAVAASGVVGRYLYGRIPRRLGAVEMSVEEAEQLCAALARQIHEQNVLTEDELRPLLELPALDEVKAMPLWKALAEIIWLDLRRPWMLWRLRKRAGAHAANHADVVRAISLARRQAALSKDAVFLARIKQIFRLWHVVHRPFSYSLAILATLHIGVVVFLGYF